MCSLVSVKRAEMIFCQGNAQTCCPGGSRAREYMTKLRHSFFFNKVNIPKKTVLLLLDTVYSSYLTKTLSLVSFKTFYCNFKKHLLKKV